MNNRKTNKKSHTQFRNKADSTPENSNIAKIKATLEFYGSTTFADENRAEYLFLMRIRF